MVNFFAKRRNVARDEAQGRPGKGAAPPCEATASGSVKQMSRGGDGRRVIAKHRFSCREKSRLGIAGPNAVDTCTAKPCKLDGSNLKVHRVSGRGRES